MNIKLRLLLFEECNRSCEGCCNKDWDLGNLPVVDSFVGYDEIMLTGGEPMLRPDIIKSTIGKIRQENSNAIIYLYTAKVDNVDDVLGVLKDLDGICITLHNQKDVDILNALISKCHHKFVGKDMKLNVFSGIDYSSVEIEHFNIVKDDITWIKNCPLPTGEEFKRCGKIF